MVQFASYLSRVLCNTRLIFPRIKREYYTVARRYEFYVRVARSEILLSPREHKLHIFELTCNILLII